MCWFGRRIARREALKPSAALGERSVLAMIELRPGRHMVSGFIFSRI